MTIEDANTTLKAKRLFDNITFNLAHMFKNKREEKKYSHRVLSKLANVSTAVISDLETGKIQPKVDTLIKLALALDIDLTDLLSEMNVEKHEVHEPKTLERKIKMSKLTKEEVAEWIRELVPYVKNPMALAPKGCIKEDVKAQPGKVIEYDSCLLPREPQFICIAEELKALIDLYKDIED